MNTQSSPILAKHVLAENCERAEPIRYDRVADVSLELLPACSYSASYTPSSPAIGFAFDQQKGVHALGSDQRCDFERPANSLALVPNGCDVFSESNSGGEYLTLSLPPSLLLAIEPDVWSDPTGPILVPDIIPVAREVRQCLLKGHPLQDTLIACLLDHTTQALMQVAKGCQETDRYIFSHRQLTLLDEFIDANLDQTLTVSDMASLLHISAGHFSRVFKASIGVSPFDDIIHRRLSRARYALRRTDSGSETDLSSIAFDCGFSSHAHMTMAFKKYLGVTPSQLRKAE